MASRGTKRIRNIAKADFDAWLTLWNGYNAFYGRVGDTALTNEMTELTWARLLDPAERISGLVAELDGEVLGLAHYLFHRSTTSTTDVCYLQDLFTASSARGQGIAGALIERVCEDAAAADASRVYWQTHESNAVARRLYDRVAEPTGFLVYRRML